MLATDRCKTGQDMIREREGETGGRRRVHEAERPFLPAREDDSSERSSHLRLRGAPDGATPVRRCSASSQV